MSTILRRRVQPDRRRVAVLSRTWGAGGEEDWALRQVVGTLALSFDVGVLTPQGSTPRTFVDGALNVHQTATSSPARLAARRDVLLTMLRDRPALPAAERRQLESVLDEGQAQWDALSEPLRELRPDLIVLADHREVGAARVIERSAPDVPVVSVPLAGRLAQPEDPYYAPVMEQATAAIVFSEAEASMVRRALPSIDVHHVGLPLAANPSVQREPHTFVGDEPYVLVLTGAPYGARHWPTTLSALVQLGFPDHAVAVSASDRLVVFRHGEERQTAGVERGTDLLRLVAWATAVVDLRPGALYGRRALEALLYGSPIVVPADSRAREHADLGRGGLWFDGPGDLLWCVEAVLDKAVGGALASQGRQYAESRYSGTDQFVERVRAAIAPATAGSAGAA